MVEWPSTGHFIREATSSGLGEIPTRKSGNRAKLTLVAYFSGSCTADLAMIHLKGAAPRDYR